METWLHSRLSTRSEHRELHDNRLLYHLGLSFKCAKVALASSCF